MQQPNNTAGTGALSVAAGHGCLVEYRGKWIIGRLTEIQSTRRGKVAAWIGDSCYIGKDGQTWGADYHEPDDDRLIPEQATVLLPPPSTLPSRAAVWSALGNIGTLSVTQPGHNHWRCELGPDHIGVAMIDGYPIEAPFFSPRHGVVTDPEQLERAANRLRALREWLRLAQAGEVENGR